MTRDGERDRRPVTGTVPAATQSAGTGRDLGRGPGADRGPRGDGTRPGVAAFDFDGTLTNRDTLVPFLRRACGGHRVALAVGLAARQARDRDTLKVATVGRLFRGWPVERFEQLGEQYALRLRSQLRPEMVATLRRHRADGHATLLVSASLGVYLRPLARELGMDGVLAVELVVGADGRLTGEVVGGLNTRGPEKASRLLTWIAERHGPDADVELWAYGDSSGDAEMLALADHPVWMGRRPRASERPAR